MDRARAWLGLVATVGTVAAYGTKHAGVLAVMLVNALQWLNLKVARRDSATRKDGQQRYAPPPETAPGSGRSMPRAEAVFLLEELAAVGTMFWALVLGFWAAGLPVHPLMYAVMLLLGGLIVLMQLVPQLRVTRRPGGAAKRTTVRSQSLH